MHRPRWHRRRRQGTVTVEMALVSIICVLFMFALFEYGRITMMLQIMENAARAGCRQATITATSYITPAAATTTVENAVKQVLGGQRFANTTDPVITIYQSDTSGTSIGTWTSTPFGGDIVVKVEGDYPLLFPTFGFLKKTGTASNSIRLSVKVMMRSEAN